MMYRKAFTRFVSPAAVFAAIASAAIFTRAATPPATQTAPAASSPVWGSGDETSHNPPEVTGKMLTGGPAGCPIMLVDDQPYDCATLEPKGSPLGFKTDGPAAWLNLHRALSPDGKLLALEDKSTPKGRGPVPTDAAVVQIWSIDAAKKLHELPLGQATSVSMLLFAGKTNLLVGAQFADELIEVNAASGTTLRRIQTGMVALCAATADGKYLAAKGNDGISVFDLSNGKRVAQMDIPDSVAARPAPPARGRQIAPAVDTPKITFLAGVGRIAFSPDGSELAAFLTYPKPRVVVWSTKGKVTFDQQVPPAGAGSSILWLPDAKGWLLGGQEVYLRDSRQVVMTRPIRADLMNNVEQFLAQDKLLVNDTTGFGKTRLYVLKLPWDKINKTLEAMKTGGGPKAIYRPGESFALKFDVGDLKGPSPQAQLRTACQKALTNAHLRLGNGNQPFTLLVKYAEAAGPKIHVMASQGPGILDSKDTGQVLDSVEANITVTVQDASGKSLWSKDLHATPAVVYDGPITDAAVRSTMLEDAAQQIENMGLPGVLSDDPSIVALPIKLDQ